MHSNRKRDQKGFTLVEIAIVLVIIGLLLGGVLKGQELITNAKIKSVTQDLEGVAAAYYAYQDRTGLLAGTPVAVAPDLSDPFASSTPRISTPYDEQFWRDLRTQGFIAGDPAGTTGPLHALDGRLIASNFDSGTEVFGGNKNFVCVTNIASSVARGMDTKLDDGVANTGEIITLEGTAIPKAEITEDYSDHSSTDAPSVVCRSL